MNGAAAVVPRPGRGDHAESALAILIVTNPDVHEWDVLGRSGVRERASSRSPDSQRCAFAHARATQHVPFVHVRICNDENGQRGFRVIASPGPWYDSCSTVHRVTSRE